MKITDDAGLENTTAAFQWINRRKKGFFEDTAAEGNGTIEVGENGDGGRVGIVISWDEDGLE